MYFCNCFVVGTELGVSEGPSRGDQSLISPTSKINLIKLQLMKFKSLTLLLLNISYFHKYFP